MEPDALPLAVLVCARLCHDLGGLAGTLLGAIDLAQEDNDGEALTVARETAETLAARLRLLRAAWGPPSEALDARGMQRLAAGLGEQIVVDIAEFEPGLLTAERTRVALAMLLLAAEALVGGGVLSLSGTPGGPLRVAARGTRAAWPQGLRHYRANEQPTGPRDLLMPLCDLIARSDGMQLEVSDAPPAVTATPL